MPPGVSVKQRDAVNELAGLSETGGGGGLEGRWEGRESTVVTSSGAGMYGSSDGVQQERRIVETATFTFASCHCSTSSPFDTT